jgi:hypothetical protein
MDFRFAPSRIWSSSNMSLVSRVKEQTTAGAN